MSLQLRRGPALPGGGTWPEQSTRVLRAYREKATGRLFWDIVWSDSVAAEAVCAEYWIPVAELDLAAKEMEHAK